MALDCYKYLQIFKVIKEGYKQHYQTCVYTQKGLFTIDYVSEVSDCTTLLTHQKQSYSKHCSGYK